MKIIPFIIFLSILCCYNYSTNAMEANKTPPSSYFSTLTTALGSTTFTLGVLLLDILSFNPQQHQTIKKRGSLTTTKISETLYIIAPPKVEIKRDGQFLIINGDYYESTLKGKLYWDNGELKNKKGTVKNPLL